MKSFLGNFYRHLAIFSGHTAEEAAEVAVAAAAAAPDDDSYTASCFRIDAHTHNCFRPLMPSLHHQL